MRKAEIVVLFIEDNPGDVDLFRELLSRENKPSFRIESFPTLKEGLERVKKGGIDVILLDLGLPDSFGFQTFSQAHEVAPQIPIVVLTVSDDIGLALASMRKGAQDYLVKGQANVDLLGRVIKYSIERKRAEEDQSFLAQAGVELAASLDYTKTLKNVANLIVPGLADCCIIDLLEPATDFPDQKDLLAVAYASCEKEELARAVKDLPLDQDLEHGVGLVLRTGKSEIYPDLSDVGWIAEKLGPEYPRRLRQVDARSYMCVPLKARDTIFGTITFLITEPGRRYTSVELNLAEALASRAALAVENARLFEDAHKALRSRDDLLAFVTHDLRNPLSSISMNAQLIQRAQITEDRSDYIKNKAQAIRRSAGRMSHLISSLLDLSKIESGRLLAEIAEHSVKEILDDTLEIFRPLAAAKGVQLEFQEYDQQLVLPCDRERMIQVLSNLIGNAIKFTPKGGSIVIGVAPSDSDIEFSVKDTGPGIDRQHLPRIFDRYWQGQNTTRGGSGLGLYIAKGIVASHLGKIWATSEVGQGSEFHFSIPRTPAQREVGRRGSQAGPQ